MHPLIQKVAAIQRRLTLSRALTTMCRIAAMLIAAALVLGLVDYFVRYRDAGLRVMATVAIVSLALWSVHHWWYLPRRRRPTPLSVARSIETHFPQLNDSLASAMEFLQQSEEDGTAGSPQLRRLVVAEVQTTVDGLPLDEVVDQRPLRRAAGWLAAVGAIVALCLALDASSVGTVLARLISPLGSAEWPREHHLVFRDPPKRLAAGQPFEVELVNEAGSLPDEVRIEFRTSTDGRRATTSEPMMRVGDMMVARRENIRESFAFRAEGGDDQSMRWKHVEVVEPPQLESLSITVHPPEYTGLPTATSERHLEVLSGTGIEVRGESSKPLSGTRILLDDKGVVASLSLGADGKQSRSFFIKPEQWVATKSGPYRVELTDAEGLAGVVGQWNVRVEEDSPPSVDWQSPRDDLYVTSNAVVPIGVSVKDNVAVQRIDVKYERSDWSESERERVADAARIELFRGPEKPSPQIDDSGGARGENHIAEYSWDIAPLKLPVGAEVTLVAEASDYRPGIGRTASPRRISIVTPEELEARLADVQAQIVRQLERAMVTEQSTREDVRRVEIQHRDVGTIAQGDRSALQAAAMNQRRVAQTLLNPTEGVPALVDAILAQLEMNRIALHDIQQSLETLSDELSRLSLGPLNAADSELTTASKIAESAPLNTGAPDERQLSLNEEQAQSLAASLAAAGTAQDDVVATLERLVSELGGKADYRRFARLIAELRQDQIAHEKATRADVGVETLPLRLTELSAPQRAKINKAAAGQSAIATRYDKIEQGMDRLAQQLGPDDEIRERLSGAVELARRLAISAKMAETARDLGENRVGGALTRETVIAAELQQVLDLLRDEGERTPEQIADGLRNAEEQLAKFREQLASLRNEIEKSEKAAAAAQTSERRNELGMRQDELRREIDKLSGRLDRLQAQDAGESTRQAANRLNNQPQANNQNQDQNEKPPSPSNDVKQAEQNLEKAAEQLAARRQQAEDDLALEIVRRFQAELTEMVERQQQVIAATAALDGERNPQAPLEGKQLERLANLSAEERQLAELAREHSEMLVGLGAVRVSLEEAERRLIAAAALLQKQDTGAPAQAAEQRALARLEGMMDAFAQTANEAAPNPQAQPGAGNQNAQANQTQRRPTFELLEVKMLRMLQVDLHERTREFKQRLAAAADEPQRAVLQPEAQELSAEQGQLAELVKNMLTRNNEQEE